jgi:hypothetical protein
VARVNGVPSVCFFSKPIVTNVGNIIHTHHRAVQTVSTLTLLQILSFTNNFYTIYHDTNHGQLWLVSREGLRGGNFGEFAIGMWSYSHQKLPIGSVNTNTTQF